MKTTAYRGLDKLEKNFSVKVALFLSEVNKEKKIIFITETWRSEDRQKELVINGLSQVKHSNHQDGLAVDIAFIGDALYPTDDKIWRSVADIAKKHGIDWGYDLWKWDKPHFQDNGRPIIPTVTLQIPKSRYSDVMNQILKELNFAPLFESHIWNLPLTEQETKELIEIAFARFSKRFAK